MLNRNHRPAARFWLFPLVLVLAATFARSAVAAEFSYPNMLLAYIKLSPDFDMKAHSGDLLQVFAPQQWQQYQHDEFSLHDKEAANLQRVDGIVKAASPDQIYTIRTNADFGEYDFDAKKFALHPLTSDIFFSQGRPCFCDGIPGQFRVFFDNTDVIDGLPMEADAAKHFLEKRKNGGYVNRQIVMELTFTANAVSTAQNVFDSVDVRGHIVKAMAIDPVNANKVLWTASAK